jgi:hypothetical protein
VRVVADTGPLHYLVLIGEIEILPHLFGDVAIPQVVRDELDRPTTPTSVRSWIGSPPPWPDRSGRRVRRFEDHELPHQTGSARRASRCLEE